MADMNPLEKIAQRQGEFDGYTLYGQMFQFHGELRSGWYVTSASALGSVRHYWVEHDQFHTVVSHVATPPTGRSYLDIGGLIEVKEAEKSVISKAVEQWTREHHEKLATDL